MNHKAVIDLHIGKSLNDLTYDLPETINNFGIPKLCKSAQKILAKAKEHNLEGDEELAFIHYMKYFNIVTHIQKRPEFEIHREFMNKFIGRRNVDIAMENVEMLKKNLKRRYELINNNNNNDSHAANSIGQIKYNECDEKKNADNGIINNVENNLFVQTFHLYNMMRSKEISLLIIDCRPEVDFINSKIIYTYICNVPEEIVQNGMTAGKIGTMLSQEMKTQWTSRLCKETIILVDWSSSTTNGHDKTIWMLRDILFNWDQDMTGKKNIFTLDGGYEKFMLQYPALTTNATYQAPSRKVIEFNILEDIEYPSLKDIEMKDAILTIQTKQLERPFIDRSSKKTALKILEEKESLTNKVVANAKTILDTESQLSRLQDTNDIIYASEGEKVGIEELTYTILEMKNQQEDYKLRINELEQTIVSLRNKPVMFGSQQIMADEAQRLEREAEQRIAIKQAEEKLLNEKTITVEREREIKLIESRKYPKPPTKELPANLPTPSSVLTLTHDLTRKPSPNTTHQQPSYPTVDRGTKPIIVNNVAAFISRDFSPERGSKGKGLTGLKNLGNTCYMNSIMQCLSNTELLVDYLITGSYKINRANTTKGKIVEEVAAMLKEIWCAQYKYISSKNFRNAVGEYHQLFRGMGQQDSHEFLTILMDWLHSDLQFINKTEIPKGRLTPADKAWQDFIQNKESYILKLFYGQIKSTVKCVVCERESATYEGFSNLSLELPSDKNRCDIADCMRLYFYGEQIRGWNCPTCKEKRNAVKKLDISKLPPILVIHFKRFYADDSLNSVFKKKQTYVDFPLNDFNVRKYVAPSELPNISTNNFHYNLYSVSNHYGVLERGHCTAFCKSRVFNRWFKFDDHRVTEIDESDVVSSAAYILFYTTHDNQYNRTRNKL